MSRLIVWATYLSLATTSGCGTCGRPLHFFTTIVDASAAPVEGATVSVVCTDARKGTALDSEEVTDEAGEAVPIVHALNDDCPDAVDPHSSYFEDCEFSIVVDGLEVLVVELTAEELDALPETNRAGDAGHGVELTLIIED